MNTEENNTNKEVKLNEQKPSNEKASTDANVDPKKETILDKDKTEKSKELFDTPPPVTDPEKNNQADVKDNKNESESNPGTSPLEDKEKDGTEKEPEIEVPVAVPVTSIPVVYNTGQNKITLLSGNTRWSIEKNARIPLTSIPQWVKQHPEFQAFRRDKVLVFENLTNRISSTKEG